MARVIKNLVLLLVIGLVGAALVASPAGAKPTWQPVTNMFTDLSAAGGSAQTPAVGVDAAGNATAIWSRYDGTQLVVQASTRPAGGTWSTPVDLAAGRRISNPQLAVDPAGSVTAVWRRTEDASSVVQSVTRPVGGSWTAPVDLSVDPTVDLSEWIELPRVAVDAAGVATATWARLDGFKYIVQVSTRPAGGTWSTPVDLSPSGQTARTPQVAVDPAGNTTVLWNLGASRFTGGRIQAVTRLAGGTWTAPVDVSTAGSTATNPQVVVAPSGEATAIWNRFSGSYGIQTATRPLGGTWATPVDLSAPGEDTYVTPEIVVDPQGTTTAIWQRTDGDNWIVASATRSAGGSWSTPVELSATGHNAWDPQLAVDQAGNATAVWSLADGDEFDSSSTVQAARRPVAGRWTAPVDLSPAGGKAGNPQIAVDPAGNATTTWSRHDGTSWIVQARGLDAAGPVVTALTGRTTGDAGRRAYSVTAHDVWSKVASATWAFSDGTTATGTSVTHVEATGERPVRVTVTDAVGNATTCTYADTYTCRAAPRAGPAITKVALKPRKIAIEGPARKTRTKLILRLTEDAKVTISLQRKAGAGKKAKQKVVLRKRLEAGRTKLRLTSKQLARKLGKRHFVPGRYKLTVKAANRVGKDKRGITLRVRR